MIAGVPCFKILQIKLLEESLLKALFEIFFRNYLMLINLQFYGIIFGEISNLSGGMEK